MGRYRKKYGAILFNSPPYIIDDKTKYLMPYATKLAQTTFMKSLAHLIDEKNNNKNTEKIYLYQVFGQITLYTDA